MNYGDTGVNNGKPGTFFAKNYGWVVGKLDGNAQGGGPKASNVQFMVDSGAAAPFINSNDLVGFQVVFGGGASGNTLNGPVAGVQLAGPAIQVQTSVSPALDAVYKGVFVVIPSTTFPSILGGLFWKEAGGVYKLDVKGKTLTIS